MKLTEKLSVILVTLILQSSLMAIEPGVLKPESFQPLPSGNAINKSLHKEGNSLGIVTVVGHIKASPQEVYDALINPALVDELFPKMKGNELRYKNGNLHHFYSELIFPWPVQNRWSLNETVFYPEMKAIRWRRIDGTIKVNDGAWRLYPSSQGTLMIYQVKFDPGIALVPDWLIEYGMRTEAPSIIINLRNYFARKK